MARIMIVDDSTVMRLNLKRILTGAGHIIVAEAQNGKEACSLYEKLLPDLVTMDISMPVMSGVDATRAIVARFPDANIVMISALNQKKMVYEALKNGARHYIIKPIDRDKVISVLNEVLLTDPPVVEKKEEPNPKEIAHFLVENINGTFFIRLGDKFNDDDMNELNIALQGIKYVKPLKIRVDFGDLSDFDTKYIDKLVVYAKEIIDLGGDYESIAEDADLRKLIDLKEGNYLR